MYTLTKEERDALMKELLIPNTMDDPYNEKLIIYDEDTSLAELMMLKSHIDYVQHLIDQLELEKSKRQVEFNAKLKDYQTR